ncbi:MAG TPA: FHA domain-containing protein [Anaerolineales bacterium]|nr:FHA domain-containing protein [Anaerolineales bacterium]
MTATLVLVLRIGLAVILYYFLWRVFQTLRQDLTQQGSILSNKKKPGVHITAQTDGNKENTYNFRQTEVVIGRGTQCNISIKDDNLSASHARLSFHHSQWWLEDLDSRNGTFLNNDRITTPTVVISSDQFKCGNTILTLRIDSVDSHFPKQQTNAENRGDE